MGLDGVVVGWSVGGVQLHGRDGTPGHRRAVSRRRGRPVLPVALLENLAQQFQTVDRLRPGGPLDVLVAADSRLSEPVQHLGGRGPGPRVTTRRSGGKAPIMTGAACGFIRAKSARRLSPPVARWSNGAKAEINNPRGRAG